MAYYRYARKIYYIMQLGTVQAVVLSDSMLKLSIHKFFPCSCIEKCGQTIVQLSAKLLNYKLLFQLSTTNFLNIILHLFTARLSTI